jgi:acetylornithine deacetylase
LEEKWNAPETRHKNYAGHKHPINFNFGTIEGGDWPSSVPSFATFQVRVGFFPDVSLESVRKEVEETVAKIAQERGIHYEIEWNGFQAEGCVLGDEQDPNGLFSSLQRIHKEVLGREVVLSPVTCTTDARHYQLYRGIPTTCFGPEAKNIHGPDESVSLKSLHDCTKVLAAFMADWCKLERSH